VRISLRLSVAAVVLCLGAAALSACESAAGEDRQLVWSDEFSGPAGGLDSRAWRQEAFGDPYGSELQCYTDSPLNVARDGQGHLVITALAALGHRCSDGVVSDYTSGRITTERLRHWRHGRLEIRAQVPSGVGTWPAFWALGEDKPIVEWPRSGEIDVMEYVAADPLHLIGTVHGPDAAGERWFLQAATDVKSPLSDGFHTYAVDWSADELVWSLDGVEYGRVSREEAEQLGDWVFDKPFYLILNVAVGGILGGPVDPDTVFPQSFVVDYVRVYQ
jgi:beta-glucanase (GH16 family)